MKKEQIIPEPSQTMDDLREDTPQPSLPIEEVLKDAPQTRGRYFAMDLVID